MPCLKTLKSKQTFERVFRQGKRLSNSLVHLIVLPDNNCSSYTVAFVAGKKLGTAVVRNRCKRLLREALRSLTPISYRGYFILMATKNTHSADLMRITKQIEKALTRVQNEEKS